jgi:fucose permease
MRATIHEPVDALGIVLFAGVLTSVLSSALTGRLLSRIAAGPVLAFGTATVGAALAMEAAAPALWVIVLGSAVFSLGFGALSTALNVYAADHFGARDINWMHASYGLGATFGPLLVTALLRGGIGWRGTMGSMACVIALVAAILAITSRRWNDGPRRAVADRSEEISTPAGSRDAAPRRWSALIAGVTFTTVETGLESAAGIWGYVFLTSGRGLSAVVAGVAVSAYWAMMFVGRGLLGMLAARLGAARVLAGAVASVPLGALLMTLPGPAFVAVIGIMFLGLATAPIFPLLTLTTSDRVGASATTAVGLQVAASAVGAAALPSGIGLVIGAVSAWTLAPALLVLSLGMCGVYWLTLRTDL